MTKEQQRIAIAEALGCIRQGPDSLWFDTPDNEQIYIEDLPDYPNDLNAIHGAENSLTCNQHLTFRKHLWDLIIAHYPDDTWDRQYISAKAPQRAEAFLKTLNLWKP